MFAKRTKQIITLIKDIFFFLKMKYASPKKESSNRIIVRVQNPNLYHRYFYNLLATLDIAGYSIYYPMNFEKFRNLRNGDYYLSLMFQNNLIDIRNTQGKNAIVLEDRHFSANYYETYFKYNNQADGHFHIPMSFHPLMYRKNLWKKNVKGDNKINAVFCFGNFDRSAYKTISQSPFKVINRADIIDSFKDNADFLSVKNKKQLDKIIDEGTDKKFIFVEKQNFVIPIENVREYISHFRYFLCCPGVFAPLSHNFAEALSAGAIPVIQKGYADLIYPPLQNFHNAIFFENIEDIEDKINAIPNEEVLKMKINAEKYYLEFIHPENAGKNIIENINHKIMYLNASERSVKLIK